jgi:hypothetical protein
MVGVAENDFSTEGFEYVLRNGFDRARCADRHEDWGFDGSVRQMELCAASARICFVEYIELETHKTIVSGRTCAHENGAPAA